MRLCDIAPYVRFSMEMELGAGWRQGWVRAYDHRLFYVTGGKGEAAAGGECRQLKKGDILYWPGGTLYRIGPVDGGVLSIISVNFDFTQDKAGQTHCLPIVSENEYFDELKPERAEFEDARALEGVLMLEDMTGIGDLLARMDSEARRPDQRTPIVLRALMTEALCALVRQADGARVRRSPSWDIVEYVHAHFSEPLTNRLLAEKFGYHENYIGRIVRDSTGLALHRYLLKVRIDNALKLLNSTDMPVSDVAQAVGFHDNSYFAQYFKKHTGHSPSEFRHI